MQEEAEHKSGIVQLVMQVSFVSVRAVKTASQDQHRFLVISTALICCLPERRSGKQSPGPEPMLIFKGEGDSSFVLEKVAGASTLGIACVTCRPHTT